MRIMPISQSGYFHYQQLVQQIEQLTSQILPSTATVLVVSKGDDDLLRLAGRTGWHFPQSEDGLYAGYYPRDSQAAIAHLEALRASGGQYLVFPATAFWWLDHYVHFRWHLDAHYQCIWCDDRCIIYRLTKQGRLLSWYNQLRRRYSQPVHQPLQPAPAGLSDSLQKRAVPGRQLVRALISHIESKERPAQSKASAPAAARWPAPAGHLRFALDFPETLPLCPPVTPFDPRQMDLHWVIPDFVPGMGGPMAIFRFIKFLEAFGHRNTVWIRAGTRHGTAEDARRVIQDAFVPIAAPVRLLQNNMDEIRGDAVIATHAWTAYPVRAVTQVRERFYFVQDFEPLFYPMGSEYLLVEATYRFGFRCLTSSRWLQNLMRSRYQVEAEHFVYAYDPGIYHEEAQIQRGNDRVAFYSRTKTPRRAVEIGLLALEVVAKRRPSLVVDFFGGTMGKINVPYEYHDHGVLSDHQLAQLYCQATIGVVFSTTNYSLIPHEMMGCGLPVVELHTESTAMDFPHDAVTLSEPTPQAIAVDIERLLKDKNLSEQQAARAKNYVEQLSWEKSARQVERALMEGILARTPGPETSSATKHSSVIAITTQKPRRQENRHAATAPLAPFFGPIVFAGQPEYYRSIYYDLTSTGKHFEFPYRSADRTVLRELPKFAKKTDTKTCIIFRPEWFAPYLDAFLALKSEGVSVIGYSTEPVPQNERDRHPDQLARLKVLKQAFQLEYDLIIHFDKASVEFLSGVGFRRLIAHPLPVSRQLFFPENLPQDFDVCFLGKSTPYREKMLAPLKMRFNVVHVAHGLRDEEARTLMNRSRLVLNIHNDTYPNFENRVVQALFCRRPVLSERLSGDLLRPDKDYILFDSPDDLCRKVTELLNGRRWDPPDVDLSRFTIDALLEKLDIKN